LFALNQLRCSTTAQTLLMQNKQTLGWVVIRRVRV